MVFHISFWDTPTINVNGAALPICMAIKPLFILVTYKNKQLKSNQMATYSVETRHYFGDGDYNENHTHFNTPEEVKDFIKNNLDEDETVYHILKYEDGQTSNPTDVRHLFIPKTTRIINRY
jgi:hypothetical protein